MLGVDPGARRAEAVLTATIGDTLLLYTDGLVERRGSDLDAGTDRLRQHLSELAGRSPDELCDALLERMLSGTPEDDVAMVAVTLTSDCAEGPVGVTPTGPSAQLLLGSGLIKVRAARWTAARPRSRARRRRGPGA